MQYKRQAVRYAFEWQKSEDGWQCDHVWVQEYPIRSTNLREIPYPWQSRTIGELQLVLTVKDEGMAGEIRSTQIPKYTGALVKLLRWRQRGIVDPIYNMVEVEPWPASVAKNQRLLTGEKIFSLAHIIRGAHVVPATAAPVQYWFINSYVDWDQFNILYDEDFEVKGTCAADKIAAQFK